MRCWITMRNRCGGCRWGLWSCGAIVGEHILDDRPKCSIYLQVSCILIQIYYYYFLVNMARFSRVGQRRRRIHVHRSHPPMIRSSSRHVGQRFFMSIARHLLKQRRQNVWPQCVEQGRTHTARQIGQVRVSFSCVDKSFWELLGGDIASFD